MLLHGSLLCCKATEQVAKMHVKLGLAVKSAVHRAPCCGVLLCCVTSTVQAANMAFGQLAQAATADDQCKLM